MVTTVYVDDFVSNYHYYLIFGIDEMQEIEDHWNSADELLVGLSHTKFFEDCRCWCDLRPIQYKFLIMRNMYLMDEMSEDDRSDPKNDVVKSLNFLIGSMIKCMASLADIDLALMKIQRFTEDSASFDFSGGLVLEISETTAYPLKVVVDNTKEF